jgi:hypothetical protein
MCLRAWEGEAETMSESEPSELKLDVPDAPDESEIIMDLFRQLKGARRRRFSRGCYDVPNKHGVYVIYSSIILQVLYVGRTDRNQKAYGVRGLRRRLRQHGTAYRGCSFRFLIVEDFRQRVLLEALATGYLCPAYIADDEFDPFADAAP